jgi:nucleotide-binding universal stress UspA family protein
LICVTAGEPGKEDIQFSGRLTRHLGASALLLSVLPSIQANLKGSDYANRFLLRGEQTLELLDVPTETAVRSGPVRDEILDELKQGNYDLLVMGTPLPDDEDQINLSGVIGQVLAKSENRLVLLVRSVLPHRSSNFPFFIPGNRRVHALKEVI